MSEEDFLKWVGAKTRDRVPTPLGPEHDRKIRKVAVLGGIWEALPSRPPGKYRADALVTADLKYHDFFQAENQLLLVDGWAL